MTIPNGGFETTGPLPGDADQWIWSGRSGWMVARYGPLSFDSFETLWGADPFVGAITDLNSVEAIYGRVVLTSCDNFEREWYRPTPPLGTFPSSFGSPNDGFLFVFDGGESATYQHRISDPNRFAYDSFELGWLNDGFPLTLSSAVSGGIETFESGWNNGSGFSVVAAQYGQLAEDHEGFEDVIFDRPIGVTTPSTIDVPAHGFSDGDRVKFFTAVDGTGGTLPSGINDRILYFVVNSTADTFEVSQTSGGSSQVMTDVGGGASYVRADPAVAWGGKDGDTAGSDP